MESGMSLGHHCPACVLYRSQSCQLLEKSQQVSRPQLNKQEPLYQASYHVKSLFSRALFQPPPLPSPRYSPSTGNLTDSQAGIVVSG